RNDDVLVRPALRPGDLLPETPVQNADTQPAQLRRVLEAQALSPSRMKASIDGIRVGSPERRRALALEVLQQLGVEFPRTPRQLWTGDAGQHRPRAQSNWFARSIEALDDEEQVPIDEAGRNPVSHALGSHRHLGSYRIHLSPQRCREADTVTE